MMEVRIVEIENKLKNVNIIDEKSIDKSIVSLGAKVKVLDIEFEDELVYHIVGSTEADPSKYKISDESPVGKALLGRKVGEVVEVEVPAGVYKCKILEISI